MKYRSVDELTLKKAGHGGGQANAFIRESLRAIPNGQSLAMNDLAKEVLAQFPYVKDRQRAYIRIGAQLKKKEFGALKRFEGGDGFTYIGKPTTEQLASLEAELEEELDNIEDNEEATA